MLGWLVAQAADGDGAPAWLPWSLTAVTTVGGLIAVAWAWWVKVRDAERAKKQKQQDREEARTGKTYKELFSELKEHLQTVTLGFEKLQDEHADAREQLARCDERVRYLEGRDREGQDRTHRGGRPGPGEQPGGRPQTPRPDV